MMKTPTESDIRRQLSKRDRLESDLRKADSELITMGRAYWQAQGLCSFPRVDALRRAVG